MSEKQPNFGLKLLTGGVSGIVGTVTIFPIDLIKTRLQNYHGTEKLGTGFGGGCINMTKRIVETEGIRGLYRGLLANLVGVAPEKAIKLAANDYFRMTFAGFSKEALGNPDKLPAGLGMLAGALAGTAQVIVTNPMETVKIRMQMATILTSSSLNARRSGIATLEENKIIPSTLSVVKDLGLRGLYRGSLSTLSRDVPFSMIFFQLFAHLKNSFLNPNIKEGNGSNDYVSEFPRIFAAGITAGAIGAFLVTPMDVVKTRYQASSLNSSQSLLQIYRSIFVIEGPGAFFKGSLQRCFIVAPLFGISLTFYEIQRKFLNRFTEKLIN